MHLYICYKVLSYEMALLIKAIRRHILSVMPNTSILPGNNINPFLSSDFANFSSFAISPQCKQCTKPASVFTSHHFIFTFRIRITDKSKSKSILLYVNIK